MTVSALDATCNALRGRPRRWLVTGSAGFIGSHLVETLLRLNQEVTGLDSFATGYQANVDESLQRLTAPQRARHRFIEGDIRDAKTCVSACSGVQIVLHHAALGAVPRSLADPVNTNATNIDGFLNMLVAARDARVERFVYAASSSTYGDHPGLPKVEEAIGRPLSPYAVTKYVNELYADVFARCYGMQCLGLRYFNVFGARQDPEGAYAAVIPCWIRALLTNEPVLINGDGETSRDFCYIDNAVQANLLAATTQNAAAMNEVYNVAVHDRTSLNQLFVMLRDLLAAAMPALTDVQPVYREFRSGDVRHSEADIGKAQRLLGYVPTHRVRDGLSAAKDWYIRRFAKAVVA